MKKKKKNLNQSGEIDIDEICDDELDNFSNRDGDQFVCSGDKYNDTKNNEDLLSMGSIIENVFDMIIKVTIVARENC